MYKCKFVADNGKTFLLGHENNNVFDIEGLSGVSVKIGTAQNYSKIGETVRTQSVEGQNLKVTGVIFADIQSTKAKMRSAFAPFQSGKLYFNDEYFVYVVVKDSPMFSPIKNKGLFSFRLFAPFPFFCDAKQSSFVVGGIIPAFKFPVNYAQPHKFGIKSPARYVNVFNDGDVETSFTIEFTTSITSSNIIVRDLETKEFLKINGVLQAGEKITVYRDENNQLRAEKEKSGNVENIIAWIDDDSNLYTLDVGDNMLLATDDEGGGQLTTTISFYPARSGVYEN